MLFVTGGAGFIGANDVRDWLGQSDEAVLNPDKFTAAGNPRHPAQPDRDSRHGVGRGDQCGQARLQALLQLHRRRSGSPCRVTHASGAGEVARQPHYSDS